MNRVFLVGMVGIATLWSASELRAQPEEDLKKLVYGNNAFALELYRELAAEHAGNFFFSPFSVSTALAMTSAGARGETAEQMAKTLHFPSGQDRLHAAYAKMLELPDSVHVANALWGQRGFPFHEPFLEINKRFYRAELGTVDFQGDPKSALQAMNNWVREHTRGKIDELLAPGDINPQTNLVLSNAIYFKDSWEYKFPKDKTTKVDFETVPGKTLKVSMMHLSLDDKDGKLAFNYWSDKECQVVQLPYKGKSIAMVLLMAKKKNQEQPKESPEGIPNFISFQQLDHFERGWLPDLQSFEKSFSHSRFQGIVSKLTRSRCRGSVHLPRFELASTFQLRRQLSDMGMPVAFSPHADFSGISPSKFAIRDVNHVACIEVNEKGTTAATATAVRGWHISGIERFGFIADRPFMFFIWDTRTQAILFMGRIANPTHVSAAN